jgi:hypothetical protein
MAALLIAVIAIVFAGQAESDRNIMLSLQQQFGRALFRECRLDLVAYQGAGSVSMRCVRNIRPAQKDAVARRELTRDEVARLVALVRDGKLLEGGHVGTDTTHADGMFETLKVTSTSGTAVLVTSGNSSFATGPRQSLLDLLHSVLHELQATAR